MSQDSGPERTGERERQGESLAEVLDPGRRIVDPHHHLWHREPEGKYLLDDLWVDTGSGHRVEKTVFVECVSAYRRGGPEHLRCVGETEFALAHARTSARGGKGKAVVAAIVANADLTRGEAVEEVLEAHEAAAGGLFRGVRHAAAHDSHGQGLTRPGQAPAGLYGRDDYRRGMRVLGRLGLTHDSWHYHHQIREFADLARAVPETTLVLDHFGTPIGVGAYADKREEIFERWHRDIADLAVLPNVVAKLGGLAMPDNGFGWERRGRKATSDELADAQRRYYLHMIDCFGPERCMFESNFPVDKLSISYRDLWNAFKIMVADFSEDEKHALFYGTAARVYRLSP